MSAALKLEELNIQYEGTMEPNWKGAMFLTVSFTKHAFASVEYDFRTLVLSLCFVLAFNTTLLVKEHQNIQFL